MSDRGRMRKRPSGGGTLRRKSPQQGQCPSFATGPVTSTRSQWPRASHKGLMHCTVKPGKYCICFTSKAAKLSKPKADTLPSPAAGYRSPLAALLLGTAPEGERLALGFVAQATDRGPRGNRELDGAHSALSTLWCQEKNTTRYCGKVAAVQNVVFAPQNSAAPRSAAPCTPSGKEPCGRRREMAEHISTY